METIRNILIADDHPLIRNELRQILTESDNNLRIIEAGSLSEVSDVLKQQIKIDLVLLDLAMPGSDGLSGFIFVSGFRPGTPIAVISTTENPSVISLCKQIGAIGYIPKSISIRKLRKVLDGILDGVGWFPPNMDPINSQDDEIFDLASRFASLSPQQMRTLALIYDGRLNKQISIDLGLSEATVKAHISAMLFKLQVQNRTQAVIALNRIATQFRAAD